MISPLKPTGKNSSVTALGAHVLLGFDDALFFETLRINNHSETVPSTQIF